MERGTFGGKFGVRHCNQRGLYGVHATAPRRGPVPELLWADLLLLRSARPWHSVHARCWSRVPEPRINYEGLRLADAAAMTADVVVTSPTNLPGR